MFLITRWFFAKYVHTSGHIIGYSKRYRLLRILTKVRNFVCTSGICARTSSIMFLNFAKSGIFSQDSIFKSSVKNCSQADFLAYLVWTRQEQTLRPQMDYSQKIAIIPLLYALTYIPW